MDAVDRQTLLSFDCHDVKGSRRGKSPVALLRRLLGGRQASKYSHRPLPAMRPTMLPTSCLPHMHNISHRGDPRKHIHAASGLTQLADLGL